MGVTALMVVLKVLGIATLAGWKEEEKEENGESEKGTH